MDNVLSEAAAHFDRPGDRHMIVHEEAERIGALRDDHPASFHFQGIEKDIATFEGHHLTVRVGEHHFVGIQDDELAGVDDVVERHRRPWDGSPRRIRTGGGAPAATAKANPKQTRRGRGAF